MKKQCLVKERKLETAWKFGSAKRRAKIETAEQHNYTNVP